MNRCVACELDMYSNAHFLMGQIGQWENRLVAGGRQMVTSLLPPEIFERNLRRVYFYAT